MPNNKNSSKDMEELPEGITPDALRPERNPDPLIIKRVTFADTSHNNGDHITVTDQPIQYESVTLAQPRPVYDFSDRTVLAVDDVSFNLDLIALFFKKTGAKVLFAANGREALDSYIAHPDIDIVLMDIQMPVMNGLDATREIRKLNPEIPVIAITAFVHSDDKQRCFEAGCNDFLSKPCSRADLLMKVNNYLKVPFTGYAG
jgi:CheY-like chemotaxis protein